MATPPDPFATRIEELAVRVASGARPDSSEVAALVAHIAAAGFSQTTALAGGRLAGLTWQGSVLRGSTSLQNEEVHYLRHCVASTEWPVGTTLTEYLESLWHVITDSTTGIFVSRYGGEWQVGFVNEAGNNRGPDGNRWILIEYRCSIDGWMTGFQPRAGLAAVISQHRSYRTWLKRL